MWRDLEKEKSLGRSRVRLWVDLEMSKIKKLEQEIQELKNRIIELQSQMLALQVARPITVVPMPAPPSPGIQPAVPQEPWSPNRPYIGDPVHPYAPTITCGSKTEISGISNQISRCCN